MAKRTKNEEYITREGKGSGGSTGKAPISGSTPGYEDRFNVGSSGLGFTVVGSRTYQGTSPESAVEKTYEDPYKKNKK